MLNHGHTPDSITLVAGHGLWRGHSREHVKNADLKMHYLIFKISKRTEPAYTHQPEFCGEIVDTVIHLGAKGFSFRRNNESATSDNKDGLYVGLNELLEKW